jgi:hypothetical protein
VTGSRADVHTGVRAGVRADPAAGAGADLAAGVSADVRAGPEVALDRPDVVAAVLEVFGEYERALVAGDVEVLTRLFWDDPRTVRYGVADRQYGAAEIAAWRATHPSVPPGRRLSGTTVLALDDRSAVVCTQFGYPDQRIEGRQTQVWVRLPEGWRIVSAHVSEVPTP